MGELPLYRRISTAVRDFLGQGDVGADFIHALWDVVRGDAIRNAAMSDLDILLLMERLGRGLSAPLNLSTVASDLGMGNYHRVNDRLDDLTTSFITWRCPQRTDGRPSPKAQRKIYFTDPLYARLAKAIDEQLSSPDASKITEQQVGLALAMSSESERPGSFISESRLMYERTGGGSEVDFVSPDFSRCYESKYVDKNWRSEARTAVGHCGGGILTTRRVYDPSSNDVWAVPAATLAWLLDYDKH